MNLNIAKLYIYKMNIDEPEYSKAIYIQNKIDEPEYSKAIYIQNENR